MIAGAFHITHPSLTGSETHVLVISRITAILLMFAYFLYIIFQMKSHHELLEVMLEAEEAVLEGKASIHKEDKLCLTECVISLSLALTMVTLLAINLVEQIPFIVKEQGVSESFLYVTCSSSRDTLTNRRADSLTVV